MRKRKKKNKKKNYIILAIILLILLTIFYYSFNNIEASTTFFHDIGSFINSIFISKKVNYLNTTSLKEQAQKEEIIELKNMLNLKETMTSYQMVYATVTSRNNDYWFYTLTIDKGKKDGIKKDMIVINEKGLVGRVIDVNNFSSIIKLITANDSYNKISVNINSDSTTYNGIITGYDINKNLILITCIRSTSNVKIGDNITTNGLGTLFPEGIYIGKVEEILSDDLGVSKVLGVKSEVNFENLKYLAVLKRA